LRFVRRSVTLVLTSDVSLAPDRTSPALWVLFTALSFACGSSQKSANSECRSGPKDDVEMGAKTGVEGAKAGAKTGVEGVKTFGKAVGGFVEGGSEEARKEWKAGKQETKRTAREGASDVDKEASVPKCR
jgi:hypothetical protein